MIIIMEEKLHQKDILKDCFLLKYKDIGFFTMNLRGSLFNFIILRNEMNLK